MIQPQEFLETVEMIQKEKLDVRTVTMEIQDLVVLLEGKSNQLPNEEINKFLIVS